MTTTVTEILVGTCDTCGAPAFLFAEHPDWLSRLAYCGHHGTKYLDGLVLAEATITDQRHLVRP